MCTIGYEGKNCENRIDYCKLYEPCKNGATCTNHPNITNIQHPTPASFYKCQCQKGWRGANCTQDIDECAQMQVKSIVACSGHGQCLNTMGSHKCLCNEYHFGAQCEHTHMCQQSTSQPCRNGGICAVVGDSVADNRYECKCAFGYAGVNCTHVTCDLEPCEHGSLCYMRGPIDYSCNCTGTGFAGVRCENRVNEFDCRQEACFGNQTCHPLRCDCDLINCDEVYINMIIVHLNKCYLNLFCRRSKKNVRGPNFKNQYSGGSMDFPGKNRNS
jgi:protein crumbs